MIKDERGLPLEQVKVLDLSRLLPGPYCTKLLAELGCEVIKVEDTNAGDYLRDMIPGAFEGLNLNKKSISVNLKTHEGIDIFYALAKDADVIVESFRPGVMKKLGIDYETLRKKNPGIIVCSISGFGQTGPYRQLSGHDINYLGITGFFSMVGKDTEVPEDRFGIALGDLTSAMFAFSSILAALYKREKAGEGSYLDVSISDSVTALMSRYYSEYSIHRTPKKDMVNKSAYGLFETKDQKYVSFAMLEDKFWINFSQQLPEGHPLRDSSFDTLRNRNENKDFIKDELEKIAITKTQEEWTRLGELYDIPLAGVNDIQDAISDPHLIARGMIQRYQTPSGELLFSRYPVKWGEAEDVFGAPTLGQHSEEILKLIGYDDKQINSLLSRNIVKVNQ